MWTWDLWTWDDSGIKTGPSTITQTLKTHEILETAQPKFPFLFLEMTGTGTWPRACRSYVIFSLVTSITFGLGKSSKLEIQKIVA